MATSGGQHWYLNTVLGANNYINFKWEETSFSIPDNTSTVDWYIEVVNNSIMDTTLYSRMTVTVEGQEYIQAVSVMVPALGGIATLMSGQTVIPHNEDGYKIFSFSIHGEYGDDVKDFSGTGNLPSIPRPVKITSAPSFNDEENPTVALSQASIYTTQICISLTGATDDIPYRKIVNKSYQFQFTNAERKILRESITEGNSRQVIFRVKTTIDNNDYIDEVTKTLTLINHTPTLSPTVTATDNDRTKELTGDAAGNTLIQYYSDVTFSSGAAARKEANIDNQYVKCGGEIVAGNMPTGTIEDVWNGTFEFVATDTRGYVVRQTVQKTIIPYIKLTCSIQSASLDTDGNLTFTIVGKYFNGSFGAKNNTFEISYDLLENGEPLYEKDQPLGVVTPTVDEEGNYTYTHTLSGLTHTNKYELTVYAYDEITPAKSVYAYTILGNIPVFDWSKDDFRHHTDVVMSNNKVIYGTDVDGVEVVAFEACNPNGNTAIGAGNYNKNSGGTHIYGNQVRIQSKEGIYLDNNLLADYVIEQDSNGTYAWRKWASGRVDLFGYLNITNEPCNTALGNMYRTVVKTSPNFPFRVDNPLITMVYESSGYGAFVYPTTNSGPTKPGNFYLVRPTSSTAITGTVIYHVHGTLQNV